MNYDFSALGKAPSAGDVQQFMKSEHYASNMPNAVLFGVIFGFLTAPVLFPFIHPFLKGNVSSFIENTLFIVLTLFMCILFWRLLRSYQIRRARRQFLMYNFADANGFDYISKVKDSTRQGTVFHSGYGFAYDVFLRRDGAVEFGNYWTKSRKSGGINPYICIKLAQSFPQIILNGKQNDKWLNLMGKTSLPFDIDGKQAISLEGDFDKFFTLYAPASMAQAALYVFTPDVMLLLIEKGAKYDLEIVGDELYVYGLDEADFSSKAVLERFLLLADGIMQRLGDRVAQYRYDETQPYSSTQKVVTDAAKRNVYAAPQRIVFVYVLATIFTAIVIVIGFLMRH